MSFHLTFMKKTNHGSEKADVVEKSSANFDWKTVWKNFGICYKIYPHLFIVSCESLCMELKLENGAV